MKNSIILSAMLAVIALTSCTRKTYFYSSTLTKLNEHNQPLTHVQFYTDKEMVLKREVASDKLDVSSGKIRLENGRFIHRIVFKKETPGICIAQDTGKLSMQFEKGDHKIIHFRLHTDGTYVFDESTGESNFIHYGGEQYYHNNNDEQVRLMVSKKIVNSVDDDKRVVKGIRLKKRFIFF
jgi:hypothetical protein